MKKGLALSQKLRDEHRLRALRWEELRRVLERTANTQRDKNEVDSFLWQHGLQQYCELMHRHAIEDLEILNELTEKHLADLGMTLGHRVKLLKRLRTTEKPILTPDTLVVPSVHKEEPVIENEEPKPLSSMGTTVETELRNHSLCQQYTPSVEIQEAQRKAAFRPFSARQQTASSGNQLRPVSAKPKCSPAASLNGWD